MRTDMYGAAWAAWLRARAGEWGARGVIRSRWPSQCAQFRAAGPPFSAGEHRDFLNADQKRTEERSGRARLHISQ